MLLATEIIIHLWISIVGSAFIQQMLDFLIAMLMDFQMIGGFVHAPQQVNHKFSSSRYKQTSPILLSGIMNYFKFRFINIIPWFQFLDTDFQYNMFVYEIYFSSSFSFDSYHQYQHRNVHLDVEYWYCILSSIRDKTSGYPSMSTLLLLLLFSVFQMFWWSTLMRLSAGHPIPV